MHAYLEIAIGKKIHAICVVILWTEIHIKVEKHHEDKRSDINHKFSKLKI